MANLERPMVNEIDAINTHDFLAPIPRTDAREDLKGDDEDIMIILIFYA